MSHFRKTRDNIVQAYTGCRNCLWLIPEKKSFILMKYLQEKDCYYLKQFFLLLGSSDYHKIPSIWKPILPSVGSSQWLMFFFKSITEWTYPNVYMIILTFGKRPSYLPLGLSVSLLTFDNLNQEFSKSQIGVTCCVFCTPWGIHKMFGLCYLGLVLL